MRGAAEVSGAASWGEGTAVGDAIGPYAVLSAFAESGFETGLGRPYPEVSCLILLSPAPALSNPRAQGVGHLCI